MPPDAKTRPAPTDRVVLACRDPSGRGGITPEADAQARPNAAFTLGVVR
jgi:hypothetical protein